MNTSSPPDTATDDSAKVFVTVAICTRNRGSSLAVAALSVIEQLGPDTELLIVDNASTDETPRIATELAANHQKARVVREEKLGLSHARNTALLQAHGEYLVFFDDDELAEPGWLRSYIEFFRNPPSAKVGCVGGPYLPMPEIPPPAWLSPTHGGFDLGGSRRVLDGIVAPAGGNCGYPRKLAIALGGFDPNLIRSQDTELNWKMRAAGYEVWWLPEARIRHRVLSALFSIRKQLRIAFIDGRDIAVFRLRTARTRSKRLLFVVARMATPIFSSFQAFVAGVLFVIGRKRTSFRVLSLAARNVGIFVQLLCAPWSESQCSRPLAPFIQQPTFRS